MTKISFDFEGAKKDSSEGGTFKPIPDGLYPLRLFEIKMVSNNKPVDSDDYKQAVSVQFKVEQNPKGHMNRRIFERFWLTPGALWRFEQLLAAVYSKPGFKIDKGDEVDLDELQGKLVAGIVGTRPKFPEQRDDDGNIVMENEVIEFDSGNIFDQLVNA